MQLHPKIMHHVRKHKEHIVAHVKKHHKKYILWVGILSGMIIYKLIGMMIIFFGLSQMVEEIGAEYDYNEVDIRASK